jgi:hypothetical protein
MDRAMDQVSMTLYHRAFKASIGVLAIAAAAAAGGGTAMTASLFGALAALALGASAALSALLELAASDRDRVWRAIAWGALVPAWIVFAAMLVHAPISYLDGLRILATGLLAGGAALRVWRWRVLFGAASPCVVVAAGFALMALGATWSGVWAQLGDTPLTAIGIAAALELCGTGSVWVTEAVVPRSNRDSATEPAVAQAHAAMQMA